MPEGSHHKEVNQMSKVLIFNIGFGILGAFFFFFIGYILRKYTARMKVTRAEERSKVIVEEAKKDAESRRREAQWPGGCWPGASPPSCCAEPRTRWVS